MILTHTSPPRRLGSSILAIGMVLAALVTSDVTAASTHGADVPSGAIARLTALGFSTGEAAGLLRTTAARPASTAGAYAAQRIAMAMLYGNAKAFGGPRYRPGSSPRF